MEFWQLLLLSIIQGITEFLPVSSSGHLVALGTFLGLESTQLDDVNIALHFGTLLAICSVYFQQIKQLFSSDRKWLTSLVIGSIPAGVVGVTLQILDFNETLYQPEIAGSMLIVTGLLLWFGKVEEESTENVKSFVCPKSALAIGLMQAFGLPSMMVVAVFQRRRL